MSFISSADDLNNHHLAGEPAGLIAESHQFSKAGLIVYTSNNEGLFRNTDEVIYLSG
ncbi:MAG: hypothetical protein KF868_11090 [Acidobacteria bacterium]|nr:hypothetical protein [Acidobacteriota bacterium]